MEQAWAKSIEETCKYFDVDESKGYTDEQVKRAQEKYGPNGNAKLFFFYFTRSLLNSKFKMTLK